jgi:outer membrane protein assembly factor BamB
MPTIDQSSRRRFLAALGTCAGGTLAGCVGSSETDAPPRTETSWPTVGYDKANTRYSPSGATLSSPTEAWSISIKTPVRQPVLANGQVYMPDRTVLRVHDATTGTELWTYTVPSDDQNTQLITEPTVRDGVVYLGTKSERESVVALDAKTGNRLWSFGGKQVGEVSGTPTLGKNGDRLYVGSSRGVIYSLDAKTGTPRWQQDVFGPIENTLAVRSPLVVATTNAGEVYAFEENGEALWRQRILETSGPTTPPTLSDRWIFIGCNNNHIYSLDPVSGSVRWETDVDRLYQGGIAVTNSSLYAASGNGVVSIGGREGTIQWSIDLGAFVSCAPMIVSDTLYIGGPRIFALKSSGGTSIASIRFGAKHWAARVGKHVGPGLATGNGRLFAPVRMNDGSAELLALEERKQ